MAVAPLYIYPRGPASSGHRARRVAGPPPLPPRSLRERASARAKRNTPAAARASRRPAAGAHKQPRRKLRDRGARTSRAQTRKHTHVNTRAHTQTVGRNGSARAYAKNRIKYIIYIYFPVLLLFIFIFSFFYFLLALTGCVSRRTKPNIITIQSYIVRAATSFILL